jgi:hypothetical protein
MDRLTTDLDRQLVDNHRFDTALFEHLTNFQTASGIVHGDRPICPFLRPFFLERSRYTTISRASRLLCSAFEKLTAAALADTRIMSELGLSEKEERWARLEPRYRSISVNSRLDTFLDGDSFHFLEYNGENPAGIGDQSSLQQLFENVPEVKRFLQVNEHYLPRPEVQLLEVLTATFKEFGGNKLKPTIAIVDWDDVSTAAEFVILAEYFTSQGHACIICDPLELEFDGKHLRRGDFAIDILFKRVIIHEFLDRFDESHPLYRAIENGAVCMANSFRSKVPHKKSSFSILSDPKYHSLFERSERACIELHIPWTRTVRDCYVEYDGTSFDLLELVRTNKDRFVLKPNDDYGGKGIFIGWECTETEWDRAIENALTERYVVQERVPSEKAEIPMYSEGEARLTSLHVDFDPFLFRGKVEGGMVRLSSSSIVNVSQGGGETALIILED